MFLLSFNLSLSSISPVYAQTAPVDGDWSNWFYTPCSKGCDDGSGPGIAERYRACNNPEPANGGAECQRKDGTYTTPSNRLEKDEKLNSGLGYVTCAKSECTGPADTTPPSVPGGVQATVLSDHEIRLTWNASTDNIEVIAYRVYDEYGVVVGRSQRGNYTPSDYILEQYTSHHLQPLTSYSFTVTALDARGNESDHSQVVSATTPAFQHGTEVINPYQDLEYQGAFKLPAGQSGDSSTWAYGGSGLTFYPAGDPNGPQDGYPGSLFGFGHAYQMHVSEISIPAPVISPTKNLNDLPAATVIQPFSKVDRFDHVGLSEPTGSLTYHPKKGSQQTDKLYHTFGSQYNWTKIPSVSASELDLSNPQTEAWWYVGTSGDYDPPPYYNYIYAMFSIPQDWADTYTSGRTLAVAGSANSQSRGPALYAIAPWQHGDPFPSDEAELSYTTLIQYGKMFTVNTMNEFIYNDLIHGGEWVDSEGKSAVVFSGFKGRGETWYAGGFMTTTSSPVLYFYNPKDLEAVVQGTKQPHEPQPYATFNVFNYLYGNNRTIASMTVDNANGLIYVFEYGNESPEIPLIHVWKIRQANPGEYLLNVVKNGTGNGLITSSPSGINCGTTCSASFAEGAQVSLTANPDTDSIFTGWSGACSGTGECTVSLNSNTTVIASFIRDSPEMGIRYNSTTIPSGSGEYDFGSVNLTASSSTVFTIENTGTGDLTLTGTPLVAISGTHASDFTVAQQPTSPIGSGASSTFELRFAPGAAGTRTATVSIVNNDSDENPYTFTVTGEGLSGPGTVTLLAPSGDVTVATPTYQWAEVATAEEYHLWVDGPSGTVINTWYAAETVCAGGTCTVTPSVTLEAGAHYWRVQSRNEAGTGPWSDPGPFWVCLGQLPAKVSPTSPPSGSTVEVSSPTFVWPASPCAQNYVLQVDGASGTVISTSYAAETICVEETCSVTPAVTLQDGPYRWWVQSRNATGGVWSARMDLTVDASSPPEQVMLISPNESVTTTTPNYQWTEAERAEEYHLWVDGPSGTVINTWYTAETICTDGTCTVTPSNTLEAGTHYYWVQPWSAGGTGLWSGRGTFWVCLGQLPSQVSPTSPPSGSMAGSSPTFVWPVSPCAQTYILQVDGPSGTVIATLYTAETICSEGTCSVTPAVTLENGVYRWWVQSRNATGGVWSASMLMMVGAFVPPGQVTPISPVQPVATATPSYTWTADSYAQEYLLWVGQPNVSGSTDLLYSRWYRTTVCQSGQCTVTPEQALADGDYRWWVCPWNFLGYGQWSARSVFSVSAAQGLIPEPEPVTFQKNDCGTGTILVGMQECGPDCETLQVPYTDYVELTVIPAEDSSFVRLEREDGTPLETLSFEVQPGETISVIFEQKN